MSRPLNATQLGIKRCPSCRNVCQKHVQRCHRCHARVHSRKPDSIIRTWALMLAGLVFYIPANVLPVMRTSVFGSATENTILSGVAEFWRSGSWDIAALIFFASVVVPCLKFIVLTMLLVTCQLKSGWAVRERAWLYRLVERLGYWSMLDVVVVALIAALVQFRGLSVVEPLPGVVFFGFVVVLMMLATMSFDPRLIWDAEVDDV
ncbi:paraquat-inducible protein A [Pseudomonas amygdali]|uniref:paraquat-inducible protein A n=1 Tax=Pseudomonas amygdali TaxID=47877 RepID=UPI001C56C588|nr:paraquat-inducible protein A [Pseudomonas amygdali]QXW42878.1 paraquat-inducible protein A [Pseudomonas amygdali]